MRKLIANFSISDGIGIILVPMRIKPFPSLLAATFLVASPSAPAVSITIEFENISTFFGGSSLARAAVEKAAADISAALTNSMNALTADTYTGVSGGAFADLEFEFLYREPSTGITQRYENPASIPGFGLDEIRIVTGMRALGGDLGRGGAGNADADFNVGGTLSGRFSALKNAEMAANLGLGRGSGPLSVVWEDTVPTVGSYSVDVGFFLGNVVFDSETDFHFDAFSPVESGKADLYTVALHEIIHAIGFGNSVTFADLASGVNWSGANAIAVAGRSDILTADSYHTADGLMSTNIYTGEAQAPAMAEGFPLGTRRSLTELGSRFSP